MAGNYLQIDETPVQVMDPEVEGRTATGWLWVYARPGGGVILDLQKSRGRDGPDRMLKSFAGTFQSDGYGLYESLERDRSDLRRVACWAHVRRKLHEALIAPLDGIEKVARESGLSPEARKDLRQQKASAMLERLHRHLLELDPVRVGSPVLPKSPLGKAIRYTPSQWEALVRYHRRWPVRDRYESGGERDPAQLCGQEELALHRPPGRRLAQRGDLQDPNVQ